MTRHLDHCGELDCPFCSSKETNDNRLSITILEGNPDDTWSKIKHAANLLDTVEDFMCNYLGNDEVDEDEFDVDQKIAFNAMWNTFDELQRQMLNLLGLEKVKDGRNKPGQ